MSSWKALSSAIDFDSSRHWTEVEDARISVTALAGARRLGAGQVVVPDHHEAVPTFDRHRGIDEVADQGEVAGAERDRDRHAADRDQREAWMLREHAQAELYVE